MLMTFATVSTLVGCAGLGCRRRGITDGSDGVPGARDNLVLPLDQVVGTGPDRRLRPPVRRAAWSAIVVPIVVAADACPGGVAGQGGRNASVGTAGGFLAGVTIPASASSSAVQAPSSSAGATVAAARGGRGRGRGRRAGARVRLRGGGDSGCGATIAVRSSREVDADHTRRGCGLALAAPPEAPAPSESASVRSSREVDADHTRRGCDLTLAAPPEAPAPSESASASSLESAAPGSAAGAVDWAPSRCRLMPAAGS